MQRGHDYEVVEESLTGYSSSTHRKVPAEEPKFKSVRILHHVTRDHIFNGVLAEFSEFCVDGKAAVQSIRLTISESCRTQSSAASSSSQLEIMAITPSVSSIPDGSAASTQGTRKNDIVPTQSCHGHFISHESGVRPPCFRTFLSDHISISIGSRRQNTHVSPS
jgi:hypothetical protein